MMNNDKNIWSELNEIPRSDIKEKNSWLQIEKKLRKTHKQKSVVAIFVTGAVLLLLIILIGVGQNNTLPIQTAQERSSLNAIYFVRNTEFDEIKVKPSSFYTNVIAIKDPYVMEHFDKYMDLMEPINVEDPLPFTKDPTITELLFKYTDGKVELFKMFDEETFYNIDTEQWYSINFMEADNETRFTFLNSFTNSQSIWQTIILFFLVIGRAISDSIIKRMYLISKIKYFEKSSVVKYFYYGLIATMIIFTLLIGRFELVIHIFWVLLFFILIGLLIIYLEKKYGGRKANFFSLIVSTIFLISILMNLIITYK